MSHKLFASEVSCLQFVKNTSVKHSKEKCNKTSYACIRLKSSSERKPFLINSLPNFSFLNIFYTKYFNGNVIVIYNYTKLTNVFTC